ncbi:MAG TPA: pyridoxamine 5'-phosphate oxidase family protein [Acetobacteraceae bacterium]|nr:pyridoxamine 5'-phosphate oxidase family protein [Acetobacteraceae bacterium]
MTRLYGDAHRDQQDKHNSRRLADLLDAAIVHAALTDEDRAFLATRDFFFLATVDAEGRPTVSYKGGDPGFVRVLDPGTLEFPLYDGNGMFLSAGNIQASAEIGMLFIDFETPNQLRLQGTAALAEGGAAYPGAVLTVRVELHHVFRNCGRYIHKHVRAAASPHVPDAAGHQPVAAWKRIDFVQDTLQPADREAAAAAGLISAEAYDDLRRRGEA